MARESRPPLATDGKKTTAEASHEASRTRRKRRRGAAIAGGLACALGIGIAIAAAQAPASRATSLGADAFFEDDSFPQGGAAEYSKEALYRSGSQTSQGGYENALAQPTYDAWTVEEPTESGGKDGLEVVKESQPEESQPVYVYPESSGSHGTDGSGSGGSGSPASMTAQAESTPTSVITDPSSAVLPNEEGIHVYESVDEWLHAQTRATETEALSKQAAYMRHESMRAAARRSAELSDAEASAEIAGTSSMTFTVELGHGIREETLNALFALLNEGDTWLDGLRGCWQLDMYIGAVSPTQRPIAVLKFTPPAAGSEAFRELVNQVRRYDLAGYCKACLGMSRLVRQVIEDDEIVTVAADDASQGNVSVEGTTAFAKDRFDENRWEYGALGFEDTWSTVTVDRKNTIAVIDTGFAPTHIDLSKMYVGAYNATTGQKGLASLYPVDYHGTHVAGILAAEAGNGSGISGLSHNANIMPVQVGTRDASGNTQIDINHVWEAFKYVLDNADEYNVKVINVSLSSTSSNSAQRAVLQARYSEYVEAAKSKGILVVAAAGNLGGGTSSYKSYPAALPDALGVMSLARQSGESADDIMYSCDPDSNYNEATDAGAFDYEVGAPGVNILSCYPYVRDYDSRQGDPQNDRHKWSDTAFAVKSGTSMATPQVAALASLVYAIDPGLTPAEVKDAICQNADKGRVDEPLAAKQGCGAIRPAATVRYVHNRTYALFTLRLGSGNAAATGNASYASNMAGAEYSVTDAVSNKEIGTLAFDGSSMEATIELARGRKYWVRQTKAPAGFHLATDPFDVTIPRLTSSNGSTPGETKFSDNLISDNHNSTDGIGGLGDDEGATPDETIESDEQPSGNASAVGSGEPLVRDIALTPQQCVIEVRCVDVSDGEAQGISCVGGDEKRFTVALCAADENGELRQNSDGSPVVILEQRTDESGHVAFGPVADGHYIVRQVYAPFPYGLASEDDRDIAVTVSEAAASSVRVDIHNKIRQGGVTVRVVNDLNESLPGASYALVALQDVKDANGEIIYAQNDVVALQQDGTGRYTAQPGRAGEDNPVLVTGDDGIIDIQGLMLGNNAETAFEMRSYGPVAGHVEASDSIVFRFDANGVPDKENGTQAAPKIVCQTRNGVVTRLVAANDNERGIPGATMAMWPQSKSVVYKAGSEESSGEVRTEFATPIDEGQATGVQVEGSVENPVGDAAAASNQCKITFKANLGKNAKSIEKSVSVAKNQPVALEANSFTKKGWTFAGWGKKATGAPLAYVDQQTLTPTEDMVLYARWTAFPKTITFNKNGGQGTMSAITAKQGDEITLPPNKLTRDGYTFVGWNTKSTGKGTKYQDEGTVTLGSQGEKVLYAQWATNARTITFDRNAGKGSMDAVPTQKGDRIKLPANRFTRKGYTFAGWNTSKDGTGQKYANQAGITVENDLTLYAQWEEIKPVDAVIIRTPGESTTKQPSAVKVDAANTLTTSSAEIAGRWHGDIQAWVIDGLAPNSRYHIKFGNHRVKTIQTSDAGNQSHYARYAPLTYQEDPEHQMYLKGCWVDQAALPQTDDLALLTTTSGEAGREGIAEFRKIVPGDANTDSVKYTVVELLPPNDIGKSEARICSTEEHRVSINRTNFTVSVNGRDWMAVESSGVFHDGETTLEIYRMSSQGGVDAAAIGREMKLTDAYGRTVDQWTIQDDSPRVFVGLAPGVYYITDIVSEDTHVIADTIEVTLMPAINLQRTTMFDAPFVIGVDVDLQQEIAKPLDNADMEDGDGENRASVGNRPAGEYSYSLDFASRSNGWVDEMIITQELPSKDGLAELVSVTTPQTWQDADGKMSVWYRTDKGGDALPDDAASNAALDAANAQPTAYAGWKLWRADVPAMEATLLSMSDLRESGALAEDENVTAIRLAYGRVEKWFATHKPPADSADADATFNKDLHDDVDEVVREHPETVQQVDPEASAVREQETRAAAGEVVDALGKALGDNALSALGSTEDSAESKNAMTTTQAAGSSENDANWQETKAAQLDAYSTLAQDSSSVQYAVLTKKSINALRISSSTMAGLHTQSPSTQASQPEGTQSYQPVIKTMSAGSQVGESAEGALSAQSHDEDTVAVPVTPELIAMLQSAILEADFDAHYAPAVITMRATEEYRAGKTLVSRAQALLHVHRPDGKGVTVEGTDSGYTPVIYDVNGGTVRVEGTGDGGIIMTRPSGSDSGSDFLYFDDDDGQGSANNSTVTPQPQTTPASSDAIPATSNYDTVQQSAKHRDVGIGTRLTASSGAKTVGLSNKSVTLTDEVHYEGLSTNRMYTVTGELHVRAGAGAEGDVFDGGVASANGKSLVAAVEFVPAESSGTVPVLFEVPASSVGACPLVAFETICEGRVLEGGGEVARHADINDAEQTVEIVSDSVPQAGGQSGAAEQPAANFPWGTGSTGASGGSANGGTPGSGSTFFGNGSRGTGNAGVPGPTSSIAQTGDAVVVAAVTLAAAGGIAFAAIRKMREGNNA